MYRSLSKTVVLLLQIHDMGKICLTFWLSIPQKRYNIVLTLGENLCVDNIWKMKLIGLLIHHKISSKYKIFFVNITFVRHIQSNEKKSKMSDKMNFRRLVEHIFVLFLITNLVLRTIPIW